ncbi:hypothetical protein BWZ20_07430 [Winogradskyella sp. J14-2]|nr:hypothetical protein BWZ20_07430 [Winogradskyella sp. J14-2]
MVLYFAIPGIFLLLSYNTFFNHHSGGNYIDIAISGIERLFKGFIALVIYLIYILVWCFFVFLTSVSAADSDKKQTLFDQLSKTLAVASK